MAEGVGKTVLLPRLSRQERDHLMKAIAKYASIAALAVASVGSANANTYIFDFSGTDHSGTVGTIGNSRTTSANGTAWLNVRATGWNVNGGSVLSSYLGAYPAGYGVKNNSGDHHSVDNYGPVDFILLRFSHSVILDSGIFNAFGLNVGTPLDSDATFAVGSFFAPLNVNPFNSGDSAASVAPLFSGAFQSNVTTNSSAPRAVNPGGLSGNLWLVAAGGSDANYDGFKLGQLTVSAVPEPATWAMMIMGFGAVGFAMRNRKKQPKVSYAF